jgi:uncharacterized protein DUF4405
MSLKTNFFVDLLGFVGFLIALEPRMTGTTIHEWFTLAGTATLILHFLIHWDWFINVSKRFFKNIFHISRLNYILAVLVFIGFVTIIASGLMISQSVLPLFGLSRPTGFAWREIHSLSTNLTLLLVAVHFALHWDWVKNAFKRVVLKPFQRQSPPPGGAQLQPVAIPAQEEKD